MNNWTLDMAVKDAQYVKGNYTFTLDSKQPILSVVLDPDHVIPDNDRSNDVWKK